MLKNGAPPVLEVDLNETRHHYYSGLLADMYQLSMAQGYWTSETRELEASFYLSFRSNPFGGGFTLACGLEQVCDYLESLTFSEGDIEFLASLNSAVGTSIFGADFLERLRAFRFCADIDAVPEGSVVFPGAPILRVTGPIADCQLVESAILNIINFQSLIATKAARVCNSAGEDSVIEFGLRRAQGPDGGLSASRAAYIGGCQATSNLLAAKTFGIPAVGTHGHSWVMAFDSEMEAFRAFAKAMPDNCTFLVDTYDTLRGVRRAIEVARELRRQGHEMVGIRIDSGDLAQLSIAARKLLDESGFPSARIFASNELDEHIIVSLKEQGARIDVWGVGTKLVTAYDQPAMAGVYKLAAVRCPGGEWQPRIKISEQTAKVTIPGVLGVRRYFEGGKMLGDMVHDILAPSAEEACMIDPLDVTRRRCFPASATWIELLEPVIRRGARVRPAEKLSAIRERAVGQMAGMDPSMKRFLNPHGYPVGLEQSVHELRNELIMAQRGPSAFGRSARR